MPRPPQPLAVEPDPFRPVAAAPPLALRVCARTDVGRERARNEDRVGFLDLDAGRAYEPPAEAELPLAHGPLALVVCDGMGGEAGGQIASSLAIEAIVRGLVARQHARAIVDPEALGAACVETILDASAQVRAVGSAEPRYARMGTTATLAAVVGRAIVCAQVGDSRAYLVRASGELVRLTRDQTFLELVRAAGGGPPIDADGSPIGANVILQAVGSSSALDVVLSRATVSEGDALVVCSDGLHGVVDDRAIARVVCAARGVGAAADALVALALEAGAPDNVSCAVARVTVVASRV